MKIKLFSSSGIIQNTVIMDGFSLLDFLTLYRHPDDPLEAATKRYVDSFPTQFNVSQIKGATIPKSLLLGGFGGDLMGFNNVDAFLTPTGVPAGTYNSVTVNTKGRITAATTETVAGSSTVHFANIINRPVNASGYVSDVSGYAVKDSGVNSNVVLTGNLHSGVTPTVNTHVATKAYLDQKVGGAEAQIPVGSLKISTAAIAGPNYLRANGAVLDKAMYAALYAVIGDTFTTGDGGMGYMGQPWRQQYAFNTQQSTDITGWVAGTPLPAAVGQSQAIVTTNRVYLLGGYTSGLNSSVVHTAPIQSDGTLGDWTTGTPLPDKVYLSQAIVTQNRVHLLGGIVNSASSSRVYTAPINSDGTLGTWTTGTSLPANVYHSQAIVTSNRVYLLGGMIGGSSVSTVYTAPINADGTLGTWVTGSPLPAAVYESQAIVTKNRVYLLGGNNSSTVYTAPINTDGTLGTWTTGSPLPAAVYRSQAVVTKNRVYLLGGYNGSTAVSTVYTAPINTDGTLGAWITGTSLPTGVQASQPIVTSNRVHLLGGLGSANGSSTVYSAPFAGGSNDYLALIANNTVNTSTQFKLPDYSDQSNGSLEYFIRALP